MIYFIKTEDDAAIKIGYSKTKASAKKRLMGIQTGNHKKLTIIHMLQGGYSHEGFLHGLLYQHRLAGEWYDYKDPVVHEFIYILINKGLTDACRHLSTDKNMNPYFHIDERRKERYKQKKYEAKRLAAKNNFTTVEK